MHTWAKRPRRVAASVLTALVAVSSVLLTACGQAPQSVGQMPTRMVKPAYLQVADDVTGLARESAAVIQGRVIQKIAEMGGWDCPLAYAECSVYAVRVRAWWKGVPTHPTGTGEWMAAVMQTGSRSVSEPGNPPLQAGDEVVLFLDPPRMGRYGIVLGPTGRFSIRDGLVSAGPDGQVSVGQTSVADLERMVRAAG